MMKKCWMGLYLPSWGWKSFMYTISSPKAHITFVLQNRIMKTSFVFPVCRTRVMWALGQDCHAHSFITFSAAEMVFTLGKRVRKT